MIKIFKSAKKQAEIIASYNDLLAKWNCDYQEIDLETQWGRTHCILAGKKKNPPLLLFHGVGDNSAVMWIYNISELAKHYFCMAVDTLGGPGKSRPNQNYNKQNFNQLAWINQLLDKLKIEKCYLAGVSNGAYVVYNYTVNFPKRVIKTLCLEGGPVLNPLKTMLKTMALLFPEILIPSKNNMNKIIRKMLSSSSSFIEDNPQIVEHLVLLMKAHNQQAMFPHRLAPYDREKAAPLKEKILFLMGDYHQEKINTEYINFLKQEGLHYKVIPQAGHAINHEQSKRINQEFCSFLD